MAEGPADICICVLFYGAEDSHLKLAQRVLKSLRCLAGRNVVFRFGCNAVGLATSTLLRQEIEQHFRKTLLVYSKENMLKYPMMRSMFHEPPIREPITLWLDHDSYLPDDVDANNWLDRVVLHLARDCDVLGSIQKAKLTDEQIAWATTQPWFVPETPNTYLSYPTGGWWGIKTELLRQFDWPPQEFKQKHGDVLLGALAKHQSLSLCHFRGGLCVSANTHGVEKVVVTD